MALRMPISCRYVLSRNWGSSQLVALRDCKINMAHRRRFLYCWNQSLLPIGEHLIGEHPIWEHPKGSATRFPGLVFSRKQHCYSVCGRICKTAKFLLRKPNKRLRRPARWVGTAASGRVQFYEKAQQPRIPFDSEIRKSPPVMLRYHRANRWYYVPEEGWHSCN